MAGRPDTPTQHKRRRSAAQARALIAAEWRAARQPEHLAPTPPTPAATLTFLAAGLAATVLLRASCFQLPGEAWRVAAMLFSVLYWAAVAAPALAATAARTSLDQGWRTAARPTGTIAITTTVFVAAALASTIIVGRPVTPETTLSTLGAACWVAMGVTTNHTLRKVVMPAQNRQPTARFWMPWRESFGEWVRRASHTPSRLFIVAFTLFLTCAGEAAPILGGWETSGVNARFIGYDLALRTAATGWLGWWMWRYARVGALLPWLAGLAGHGAASGWRHLRDTRSKEASCG